MEIRKERLLGIGSELLKFFLFFPNSIIHLHLLAEGFYFWLQIFKLRK
jgi:hypothetical protein